MSTYQPPGGAQPDGTPGLSQPQDPWEGAFDPGVASMPTDPIHSVNPAYPSYPTGVGQGDVWSQQTVQHPGQYGYVPQPPKKSRAGVVVLAVVVVLIFGGGAGAAAWYVTANRRAGATPTVTGTASARVTTPSTDPTTDPTDPHTIVVGDCIVNWGTLMRPAIYKRPCTTPGSYKVIFIATGSGIPEGANNKFDAATTSVQVCAGTGYQSWYGSKDQSDSNKDVFFCMTNNP